MGKNDMVNGIQTACGWARVEYYDDGIARGIKVILDDEIVAMLDVIEANVERDIPPEARVLIYGNGSDEPTICENV